MLGKELDDLSFKELQHLEEQLSEGILSVKDKKVLSFILSLIWSHKVIKNSEFNHLINILTFFFTCEFKLSLNK